MREPLVRGARAALGGAEDAAVGTVFVGFGVGSLGRNGLAFRVFVLKRRGPGVEGIGMWGLHQVQEPGWETYAALYVLRWDFPRCDWC